MMSIYLNCICWIIIIAQLRDTNADPPVIKPVGNKLELEPGELLSITCVSSKRIKFIQPHPKQFLKFKSSMAIEQVVKKGPTEAWIGILQKPRTNIADSGFYGCTNDDVEVDVNKHNQTNVAWIEVTIPNW